ncbi:hypothetical protein QUF61_16705, partial [Candidatus Venteria ishoeyi]|uniref:hypothetical protein n=1 Tax=Candidatus Venteria ishoeyi TaxID=1899563 RepID=UPI0025A647FD
SPVTCIVRCVRFTSLVHVCSRLNRLQRSAKGATLATGGWLDLFVINCLITPDRDFHSVRNDKLRLSHNEFPQNCLYAIEQLLDSDFYP